MPASRPTGTATLNTSHALAGRLTHGYVFSEGTGTTRNLVQTTVNATPSGGAAWVTNAGGSAVSTNPGWIDSGLTTVIPQAPFHIVVGYRNATNSGEGQQALVANILDGGTYTNAAWPFLWFYDGSTNWVIDANAAFSGGTTGSYGTWADPPASVFTAGPHHLHLAVTATETTLYKNGTSLGTQGKVIPGTTNQPVSFGGNMFGWMNFRADFDYVYIFTGTLTTQEIADLQADPYSLVGTPTRFYLPSTGTSSISPAFDAAWNDTSSVTTRPANTTRGSSAFAEVTDAETSSSNQWDVCLGRFVSEPLAAQTISGSVMGIIRARESNTAANARSQMVIRVVSGDGATVRGTLLAQNTTTTNINEWVATTTVTAARNARFPVGSGAATLTPVVAQQGDRIVIEVGGRAVNTSTTSYTLGLRFGENSATALTNDETGTSEGSPWIEFDSAIQFYTAPAAQTVTATAAANKPTAAATSTQTFPARAVTATAEAKKPTAASTATQTFPARAVSGTAAATKPTAAAIFSQIVPNQSLKFDNDSGHIRYSLTSAWNFPDADWTVGIIASISNPAGSASQYFISTGAYGGTQTFNFLAYEASSGTPGRIELNVRGSGTAISVSGANDTTLINSDWRLWIVERVKATETFNIYYVPTNGTRTLYATASSVGFDGSTTTTPTALATRAPPASGSLRWMDGSIHSVFKIDELLSVGEMQSLGAGLDLITDLGRAPVLLTRLKDLTSPVPNSGSGTFAAASINGGVVPVVGPAFSFSAPVSHTVSASAAAPKPTGAATSTQTFPARDLTGAVAATKPSATSTATQVYPARAIVVAAVATKPAAAATVTQVFPARAVVGAVVAVKPTAGATSTQTSISRSIVAAATAKKPTISAASTQTSIARTISAAAAAPKPSVTATSTQSFPARSLTASAVAKKPGIAAAATQVFPSRSVAGSVAAQKPVALAVASQQFPSRDLTATASAPKPNATATVVSSRTIQASAASKKPTAAATVEQTFPARSVTAAAASKKPTASATAIQEFPARNVVGAAVAAKPAAAATSEQEFTERYVEAAIEAPKPWASAIVIQSTIGSVSVFGSAESVKPTATATATQEFPERFVSAAAVAPKPTASAAALTTRKVTAAAVSPKPTASATAGQTFPARSVSGAASVKKPMLTATATHPYPAHIVAAAATAPKPTASATAIQVRGVSAFATATKPTAVATATQVYPPRFLTASATAKKPTVQAFVEQIFPARSVDAIAFVAKPTAAATATHGPSPGAAHIANTVHMSGFIDYEQRITGSIEMDILIAGAIETDIAVTGFIEE